MGALIGIKEKPKTIKDDAYIAYMGPLAGLLSILPFYLLYFVTHQSFWMVMVQVGAMLNLFNLIPMMPLDGGHIARMLSKKLLIAGLLGVLAMAIFQSRSYPIITAHFWDHPALHYAQGRKGTSGVANQAGGV